MRRCFLIWVFLAAPSALGCARPAQATPPALPLAADEHTRRAMYERYKLTDDIRAFRAKWRRADGEYQWPQLRDVARQFPESHAVYRHAESQAATLNTMAAVGGGIVGATVGYNLGASEENRLPGGTQTVMYSFGGGLVLVGVVAALALENPAERFAEVYNRALSKRLRIVQPRVHSRERAWQAWLPRPTPQGCGWKF